MTKIFTIIFSVLAALAFISQTFFFMLGVPLGLIFSGLALWSLQSWKPTNYERLLKIIAVMLMIIGVVMFITWYPWFVSILNQ